MGGRQRKGTNGQEVGGRVHGTATEYRRQDLQDRLQGIGLAESRVGMGYRRQGLDRDRVRVPRRGIGNVCADKGQGTECKEHRARDREQI